MASPYPGLEVIATPPASPESQPIPQPVPSSQELDGAGVHLDANRDSHPKFWNTYRLSILILLIVVIIIGVVVGSVVGTRRHRPTGAAVSGSSSEFLMVETYDGSTTLTTSSVSGPSNPTATPKPINFSAVYKQDDPGKGIGGYDLLSTTDRSFAFDYDHSGKLDHIVLYRPGHGAIFILKHVNGVFSPVYKQGDPGTGIGGYNLMSAADMAFAFDYEHSGKLDYLALYRPSTGTIWILKNDNGSFSTVYQQGDPGNGIADYNLKSPRDRAFAFDYDHSGKLDHIALYRPGTGTFWILKNDNGNFSAVYHQGDPGAGIGGYDISSPADSAFAFDYDHSGKLDHIVLYRPGNGTIWILRNQDGNFIPVYQQGDPEDGIGIGGFDLARPADSVFAFDCMSAGRQDCLVLFGPGTGIFWILEHRNGTFIPLYGQSNLGAGIAGYSVKSPQDRGYAFDYRQSGKLDHMVLYRPGSGSIYIVEGP